MNNLLTPFETAEYLGITLDFLRVLRQRRAIRFIKVGYRTIRYRKGDLDDFIERQCVKAIDEGEQS